MPEEATEFFFKGHSLMPDLLIGDIASYLLHLTLTDSKCAVAPLPGKAAGKYIFRTGWLAISRKNFRLSAVARSAGSACETTVGPRLRFAGGYTLTARFAG
ncbi:MAG TPA: hypothetical protein VGL91_24700 [Acidobacteriota bacterium]